MGSVERVLLEPLRPPGKAIVLSKTGLLFFFLFCGASGLRHVIHR